MTAPGADEVAMPTRLVELAVKDLGPVRELSLLFDDGMTALTGETGAGKTMLTEAIKLLCGARSESTMVRAGADEAVVEGRFADDERELVVRRVVPASGRSRAYLDGSLATLSQLADTVGALIDLHGQNGHQSLVRPAVQRGALDAIGGIDTSELVEARRALAERRRQLDELGGDARARNREIDLLRYQLDEIDQAHLDDPDEDAELHRRELELAGATEHRQAAREAADELGGDGAGDAVARVVARLEGRSPFAAHLVRLRSLEAELSELALELGRLADDLDDDPEELASVQQRREVLAGLRRKYGSTLAEVIDFRDDARKRVAELETHDARSAELEAEIDELGTRVRRLEAEIGLRRREAAPPMAAALQARVQTLALPNAVVEVRVGDDDPGDDVEIWVAMSSGASIAPLTKAASGGELSRTMLALQLELSAGPPIMIFDEVDAGVGGRAATAVADALAGLGGAHQVLVVTHLAQIAAAADHQVQIVKHDDGVSTETTAERLDPDARVIELARMLAGDVDSSSARAHAAELLQRSTSNGRPRGESTGIG